MILICYTNKYSNIETLTLKSDVENIKIRKLVHLKVYYLRFTFQLSVEGACRVLV